MTSSECWGGNVLPRASEHSHTADDTVRELVGIPHQSSAVIKASPSTQRVRLAELFGWMFDLLPSTDWCRNGWFEHSSAEWGKVPLCSASGLKHMILWHHSQFGGRLWQPLRVRCGNVKPQCTYTENEPWEKQYLNFLPFYTFTLHFGCKFYLITGVTSHIADCYIRANEAHF